MEVKKHDLRIWNELLDHEARRVCAIDHWAGELSGHAKALRQANVIDDDNWRECSSRLT